MTLLTGDLSAVFAAAFAGLYLDATLHRPAHVDDGKGGGSTSWADEPVKAQIDQTTQAMQAADGFVGTDQRILVLARGVDPITSDCEISVGGRRWMIASVTVDPAGSYYDLRGRRKS